MGASGCYICNQRNQNQLQYQQQQQSIGQLGGMSQSRLTEQYIYDIVNKILGTLVRIEEKLNEKKD
jgi:hypothetical protein